MARFNCFARAQHRRKKGLSNSAGASSGGDRIAAKLVWFRQPKAQARQSVAPAALRVRGRLNRMVVFK